MRTEIISAKDTDHSAQVLLLKQEMEKMKVEIISKKDADHANHILHLTH